MESHSREDFIGGKPWLRLRVACENCGSSVDAPLVVSTNNNHHHLELSPLKVASSTLNGELVYWAILCTECLPSFTKLLKQRHPDDTIQVTEVDAKDAARARQLLENGLRTGEP